MSWASFAFASANFALSALTWGSDYWEFSIGFLFPYLIMAALGDDRIPPEMDDAASQFRPRRHDDDDDASGDDDVESTTSAQAADNKNHQGHFEEEKELPPHACA